MTRYQTWMAGTSPAMSCRSRHAVRHPAGVIHAQRLQFARQRVGPLGDVAGAEADDVVAGLGDRLYHAGQRRGVLQRDHLAMAVRAQAEHEMSRSMPAIGASPAG